MTNLKTTFSMALALLIAPQAFAHNAPLPHQHGIEIGLAIWAALFVAFGVVSAFAWKALKQGDK